MADVAVVAARSRKWGETPVAFVVRRTGSALERAELMQWTNTRVGRQQRIADVLWRDSLPRNDNGKILKRDLRATLGNTEY